MSTFQRLIENQVPLPDQQRLRIENMQRTRGLTGRPLIVYAADWLTPLKQRTEGFSRFVGLDDNDILPVRELVASVEGRELDVLIHSPGGLGETAERLVKLFRQRFDSIRFIVPHSAMSAATMLCFSGNSIAMNEVSALGPIDPQVGGVPARAIKKGFERVRKAIGKTPGSLAPYLPLLQKYDLHTFELCDNAEKLAKRLARDWLRTYMFAGDRSAPRRVTQIVKFFASHDKHLSHSRGVGIEECIGRGLKIYDLRQDRALGELIWELWQRIEFFFGATGAAKLFENAAGVSFMRLLPQQAVFQLAAPFPLPAPALPVEPTPPQPGESQS